MTAEDAFGQPEVIAMSELPDGSGSAPSFQGFTGSAAEAYEAAFVPAIAEPVGDALMRAAELQPGERVVDVACGTGFVARRAAASVGPSGAVTGIDVAPEMLDVATRAAGGAGAAIDWREGDAMSLPVADASQDAALCQMGLMFVPDKVTALAEMRRVLADGGRVVVNTPGRMQPLFEILDDALAEHIDPQLGGFVRIVFSMSDPDELAGLLRSVGLAEVDAWTEPVELRLPTPREFLWEYVASTPLGAFVPQASDSARAALEEAVCERWAVFVDERGNLDVEQPIVVARGRQSSSSSSESS